MENEIEDGDKKEVRRGSNGKRMKYKDRIERQVKVKWKMNRNEERKRRGKKMKRIGEEMRVEQNRRKKWREV